MQFGYLVDVGLFLPVAASLPRSLVFCLPAVPRPLFVVLPSLLSCGLTLEFVFSHGLSMSTLIVCT